MEFVANVEIIYDDECDMYFIFHEDGLSYGVGETIDNAFSSLFEFVKEELRFINEEGLSEEKRQKHLENLLSLNRK